jgi:hypothetical protein
MIQKWIRKNKRGFNTMRVKINKTENELNITFLPEIEEVIILYIGQLIYPFVISIITYLIWKNYFLSIVIYILGSLLLLFGAKASTYFTRSNRTINMNINTNSIIINYKVFGLQNYNEELYIADIAKIYKRGKNPKRNFFYLYSDMARLIIEGY